MLLIAAALEEELRTGMVLCREVEKIDHRGIKIWRAVRGDKKIMLLKTGVGPIRSAKSLAEALMVTEPDHILVIGYAGALDPGLELGDLVAVEKALAISLDEDRPHWEYARTDDTFELVNAETLAQAAKSIGLSACVGNVLTSSHVLGSPAHKHILWQKLRASIVDMETAALACIAASRSIPFSCVRAVSDRAQDAFLEPFSYDPSTPIPARAKRLLDTGMVQTYREWKNHSSVAKERLSRFLGHYL